MVRPLCGLDISYKYMYYTSKYKNSDTYTNAANVFSNPSPVVLCSQKEKKKTFKSKNNFSVHNIWYVHTKCHKSVKVNRSCSFSFNCETTSFGDMQRHKRWWHVFWGWGASKLKLKSRRLHGNELWCSSTVTNQNSEVLRTQENTVSAFTCI